MFRSSPPRPGWVALALYGERACVAHVEQRDADRPVVHWLEHLDWTDDASGLQALARRHDLRSSRLLGVLRHRQYLLSAVDAPELPRPEWRDALRWRLQDIAEFPMHDASIDLLEIPPELAPRGRASVLAVASPHAPLAELVRQAREARLHWSAFDITECALRNLSARARGDTRAQALLHIGADHGTLIVTADGELLASRTIEVRLAALAVDPALDPEGFTAAADRVGLEVQRTLDSFERQFGELTPARLLVAPARLDALLQHLASLVYVPVEPLELDTLFDLAALPPETQATPQAQADAAITLGAALRPEPTAVAS